MKTAFYTIVPSPHQLPLVQEIVTRVGEVNFRCVYRNQDYIEFGRYEALRAKVAKNLDVFCGALRRDIPSTEGRSLSREASREGVVQDLAARSLARRHVAVADLCARELVYKSGDGNLVYERLFVEKGLGRFRRCFATFPPIRWRDSAVHFRPYQSGPTHLGFQERVD